MQQLPACPARTGRELGLGPRVDESAAAVYKPRTLRRLLGVLLGREVIAWHANDERVIQGVRVLVTKRILIVDDDASTLKALSYVLRLEGYEVDTCEFPVQALAKLRATAPDILLTDQVMGEMTGLELARQAIAEHAGVRCFVMSGHAAPSPSECAHVTWIRKPIDVDVLFSTLEVGASV